MWQPIEKDGKVNDIKWELKHNDVVLATIFFKPIGKYSLWISTPVVFDGRFTSQGKTYLYKTLDEARAGFEMLLKDRVLPWAQAVVDYTRE